MRIRLTDLAQRDLESIETHLGGAHPTAAIEQVLRVLDALEPLREFPNLGRPGRVPGTRELVVGGTPYLAVYRVRLNVLWVVRVLHGARRWP